MIPRIQQERPNVIKCYYCSICGTKLQHSDGVNQESWRFCPVCGQQIEWDKVTDVVWEEKSCDICGGWLIKKHPLGFWYASATTSVKPHAVHVGWRNAVPPIVWSANAGNIRTASGSI